MTIAAVGRLKAGPERALAERFVERATAAGRKLGLTVSVREFPESRAGSATTRATEEAATILAAFPETSIVALDGGGANLDSVALTRRIEQWRDGGTREVVFAIGGPDGLAPSLLAGADLRLAFGAATWPHQLVRLMLAEQLYRAVTILAGHPYHRA